MSNTLDQDAIKRIEKRMTKDKMIYDDAKTIGVDEQSLKQLMNILTPRMQKQLMVSLKEEKFLNDFHNNSEVK
tara:strand:- start:42 stop:260 length:219 start_codon:yes stop_codon:yes gene_type:complete